MSYYFPKLCDRIAASITKMPFHWTSIWHTSGGETTSLVVTKGTIWATKILTFDDDWMYADPRTIEQLTRTEMVEEISLEQTLRGPLLRVTTRYRSS